MANAGDVTTERVQGNRYVSLRPALVWVLGLRMEASCERREQREASPLPGHAAHESAWGDIARCGCCNTRSSAAPPHRVATPRSWHWCCPPCCGRSQRPRSVSCTPQGQLALLLPEHLRGAGRKRGDETDFAAVTSLLQTPLLEGKDHTWLLHTLHVLFLPFLQFPPWTEPHLVEEAPVAQQEMTPL